nr:alpha/beta hydrolase [Dyella sp. ASV24]
MDTNDNNPAIVLVHGFWGGPAHWHKVIIELARRGHRSIHAVDLPLTSLAHDIERTRQMIDQRPGPVLLVGHSYGGAVITAAGNNDKVKGLVFIAAFAPDAGESPQLISQQRMPIAADNLVRDSDGYLWIKQNDFHLSFCQDLPQDEGYALSVTQKAPLAATFRDVMRRPAWRFKPSWYQISTEDRMISPRNQQEMAVRMAPEKLIALRASHASLLSQPEEVATFISEAASRLVVMNEAAERSTHHRYY